MQIDISIKAKLKDDQSAQSVNTFQCEVIEDIKLLIETYLTDMCKEHEVSIKIK